MVICRESKVVITLESKTEILAMWDIMRYIREHFPGYLDTMHNGKERSKAVDDISSVIDEQLSKWGFV